MKILTAILLLTCSISVGQPLQIQYIASTISNESVRKNLYYLASDQLEGREMASHGDTLASAYISDFFRKHRLVAPYDNGTSYFQAVTAQQKSLLKAELKIGDIPYKQGDGWIFALRNTENIQVENIPVVFAGYGIEHSHYNDFANIDVKGKAVLLISGQPRDSAGAYLLTGTKQAAIIASQQQILKEKGAVLILLYTNQFKADSSLIQKSAFQTVYKTAQSTNHNLPILVLSEERVNELIKASKKTIKSLIKDISSSFQPHSFQLKTNISSCIRIGFKTVRAPNVIGVLKGTDSAAGCVILSAHHDHLGRDGNKIYYGAVDNASGSAAIMEIAALMNNAVENGYQPKRSIVFASYTGEEKGLLGSYYFAANPLFPIEKTYAVLNIDMMGRVDTFYSGKRADSNYAYILVVDSLKRGLRNSLLSANEKLGKLTLDTYYEQPMFMQRRLMGSDQYPFYLKGVPFIRIDCGFSKEYHQSTDTPDKINYELLTHQIKLAFLTIWNLANN